MMCFGLKDRKRVKTNHCVIVLLDDTQLVHELHATSTGQDLLDVVIKHLNLLETSYFGLRYLDATSSPSSSSGRANGNAVSSKDHRANDDPAKFEQIWLDVNRSAIKQLKDVHPMTVYFGVKYYASDPCKLAEEITRYQFFLQCKQDILHSRLPIPFDLAVELFALAVQSELGDYDPSRHQEGYVGEFQFLPNQTHELEKRVALFHRSLTGQVPATAELNFLEQVKWLDLYGCELHPIQYEESSGEEYALGLNPTGVLVLRNRLKVAHYLWPRIVKTKCQGRCFLMDVIDNCGKQAGLGGGRAERNRFGFRLADKAGSQRLRWAIEEHKSFYHLIHNSASLNQLAQRQQQLKLGQRFRHSIRSAISVGQLNDSAAAAAAAAAGIQQQLAHQQTLRSSMKSTSNQQQQYALDARAPPTVVRMPSRRYSNRSMTRGPYILQQQQAAMIAAGQQPQQQAHTMVDSQRQQALMMMSQFNQMGTMAGKSQTLKPMPTTGACSINSKEAKRNPYYQMLMMMAAGDSAGQKWPEVAVLPPGRHVVQPSIYKASSVVNGINQLGGSTRHQQVQQQHQMTLPANHQRQRMVPQSQGQLVGPIAMQFFNTAPRPPQYYGHESPRSTKSAIAPSSALRLASKKLAKQQQQHQILLCNNQQQHGQRQHDAQALLAYESQQQQQQHAYALGDYYGESQNTYMMGGGTTSANVSPRSVRSARMASRSKSKSTNENLHLLHNTGLGGRDHLLSGNKMLLTTANIMPPPGYHNSDSSSPPSAKQGQHQPRLYSDNESDMSKLLSKRTPIMMSSKKRATFALNNDQANLLLDTNGLAVDHQSRGANVRIGNGVGAVGHRSNGNGSGKSKATLVMSDEDDDYCCSRSDCSSIEEGESKENVGHSKRSGAQRSAQNQRVRKMSSGSNGQQQQLEHIQPGGIRRSHMATADDQQQQQQSDWNAIRRRHNDFSNGKGFLAANAGYTNTSSANGTNNTNQRQQVPANQIYSDGDQGGELNNSSKINGSNGSSQVIKHIANKQATPILLSMNYEQENNANNKAVKLLNLQRQQLHSQSSQSSDGGCGTKSSSSAADSAPSSVASSPQANTGGGGGQNTQATNKLPTIGKSTTADSTTSSSTTSGYYAGSVNSTGSASVDSEGSQGVDGPSHHLMSSSGSAKQVTIKANNYQSYKNSSNIDWQQQQQEGSRAKIALGSHGARISGTRLLIGDKAQFHQKSTAHTTNDQAASQRQQQPQRSQQKQQFYLCEANNNQEDDDAQLMDDHLIGNGKAANIGQQQQPWLPMDQIQTQNAPSSLKPQQQQRVGTFDLQYFTQT